jgi:hypothetical protein
LLKGARPELPRRLEQELAAFGQEIKQAHRQTGLNVKRAATDDSDPRIFAGLPVICDVVNATVSHAIVASPVQSGFTPARRSSPAAADRPGCTGDDRAISDRVAILFP